MAASIKCDERPFKGGSGGALPPQPKTGGSGGQRPPAKIFRKNEKKNSRYMSLFSGAIFLDLPLLQFKKQGAGLAEDQPGAYVKTFSKMQKVKFSNQDCPIF